jgi:uncharacterized peroxidase-related enzyme
MSRFTQIAPEKATGNTKELLDAVKAKLGLVPNLMRALANSPAALSAYLQFNGALAEGSLSAQNREQISLAVGQANECDYCVSAHCALGKMAGLTPDQIRDSRQGSAEDGKTAALLRFSRKLVEVRGQVSDGDVDKMRKAGFTDGEIAEAVAGVALNIFTNYFNHVAGTDIDFPKAPALSA